MADNQPQNPFFFFNLPPHNTTTKTNPPFPTTNPSSITTTTSPCNSSHLHNQQHQEKALSLSLSFSQQQQQQQQQHTPLGPFTGYSSVLSSSRFLRPAQLVLDELFGCYSDLPAAIQSVSWPAAADDEATLRPAELAGWEDMEFRWKDSRLMVMLDEVYRRYKLYCQQMQTAVASFEAVPGLGNAAPFIYFAIRIVSSHFTALKNALLNQIRYLSTPSSVASSSGCRNNSHDQHPEALQHQNHHTHQPSSTTFNPNFFLQSPPPPPPAWRSQRGLPDHAVAVLKTWLFEHFLHPYPTDSEKQILAQQTGLSRTQVSNWFINARVRIWKPMVEEIQFLDSERKSAASPSPAGGFVGSKRTRNSERREREMEVVEHQIRNAVVDCSPNDGVSLALALPRTTNIPVSNPSSSWPFSAGQNGFTGGGGGDQWCRQ